MATKKAFLGASGERIIAVADGDFFTDNMSLDWNKAEQSSIEFFSDPNGENLVTPTAGTITVTGTPDGVTYFTMPDGTFNAADSYLATRTRPNGANAMIRAKITLAGVTGAAYFKAYMWRS